LPCDGNGGWRHPTRNVRRMRIGRRRRGAAGSRPAGCAPPKRSCLPCVRLTARLVRHRGTTRDRRPW
jgi:hypothetical protein